MRKAAALLLLALALAACGGGAAATPSANPSNLAPAPDYAGHPTIDGIPCETTERVTYHVHAHLAVFVDGQPKAVPYGIGIAVPRQVQNSTEGPFVSAGGCFYWLHTHTEDGIIHVEAPVPMDFTLGQFFDVWQQPLSDTQAGPAKGTVLAYLNGQRYQGDVRQISLAAHNLIQLDAGQDVPPQPFTFPSGL
ncbi:MAG TPA: hypothetical protein VK009_07500 [Chloroflexota bacterium]|nr:hypothetical protein [Chloroflexota bacterium]